MNTTKTAKKAEEPVKMCTFGVPGFVQSSNPVVNIAVNAVINPSLAAFPSTVVRSAMAAMGNRLASIVANTDVKAAIGNTGYFRKSSGVRCAEETLGSSFFRPRPFHLSLQAS